jgi:hypothetical protein
MSSTEDLSAEQATLKARVEHYRKKGFTVTKYPDPATLPGRLRGYSLDFLAVGHSVTQAGIVRAASRRAINGPDNLVGIAEAIEAMEGWELDVVMQSASSP